MNNIRVSADDRNTPNNVALGTCSGLIGMPSLGQQAQQRREAWLTVATLFAGLGIIWGVGYDIIGVFVAPLSKEFGWDRTRVSLFGTALSTTYGVSLPIVGWLLDRVEAGTVISGGAIIVGGALLLAGHAHSFSVLLTAYCILGIGTAAGSLLPATLVIANWFGRDKGKAIGLALAGIPVGEMGLTVAASYLIGRIGWRTAYLLMAVPALLVIAPVMFLVVRTRPEVDVRLTVSEASGQLPGFEVGAALRTRAFWLLAVITLLYTFACGIPIVHAVPYLIDLGYKPRQAALMWGATLGFTIIGRPLMGILADRFGTRLTLIVGFLMMTFAMLLLLGAADFRMFVVFLVIFGLFLAGPVVVLPVLQAETLGMKRFGSLSGLLGLCFSVGLAAGPIFGGRIYDLTSSYTYAFEFAGVISLLAGVASLACTKPGCGMWPLLRPTAEV